MTVQQQKLCLLGATGSIGCSTIKAISQHRDRFAITTMAVGSNWKLLLPLINEWKPKLVCVYDEASARELQKQCNVKVCSGLKGLIEVSIHPDVDTVVNGLVGSIGCEPTLAAIAAGKRIGLANKETMVMAGSLVNAALKENPTSSLYPIDSEHSAIFQCLADRPVSEVDYLILTASGGPFRNTPKSEFEHITVEKALNHPTWSMGPKITIDSATMMNKGLEVIEAHHLFNMGYENIRILVHPSSTVHSLVQFCDGSLMAQLGSPEMQLPILLALTYPERWKLNVAKLELSNLAKLEFYELDRAKFPCVDLAYMAGTAGGLLPAALNAANEEAVASFLNKSIRFIDIPMVIENILNQVSNILNPSLSEILAIDTWARTRTRELLSMNSTK